MKRSALFFASTLCVSAATNFFDYDVEDADDEHVMRILLDTEINMHHNTDAMHLAGYGSQIVDAGSGVFMGGSGDAFVGSSFTDGGDGPVPGHPTHPTVHHDDSNHEGFEGSADYFGADGISFEGSADDVGFDDTSAAPVATSAAPVDSNVMLGGNGVQTNCATVTPCCVGTEAQTSALQAADGSCSCDSVDCTPADTTAAPVHAGDHSGTVHFEGSADDSAFEGSSDSLSHATSHQEASTGAHSDSSSGDWDHEFGTGSADIGFAAGSGAAVVFHGDDPAFEGSSDSLAHHGTVHMPTFEGSGTGDDDGTEHSGFKHGSH